MNKVKINNIVIEKNGDDPNEATVIVNFTNGLQLTYKNIKDVEEELIEPVLKKLIEYKKIYLPQNKRATYFTEEE